MSVARFVADQRTFYRVPHTMTCSLLGVPLSWFYKWISRTPTPTQRRRAKVDAAVAGAFSNPRGVARLAPAARRPARGRLDGVGEDGRRLDAPAGPDRPRDLAPQWPDEAGQDRAEVR